MSVKKLQTALFSAVLAGGAAILAQPAQATYGQIMQCVGTNNCGMAGAGLGIAQDATSGNEAMVSMGWFNADVAAHLDGNSTITAGIPGAGYMNIGPDDNESRANNFFNGSAGGNYRLSDKIAVNLSFYPGGGATDYDRPRTSSGVNGGAVDGTDHQIRWRMFNLQPSISWSPTKNQSYGFGVVITRADMKTDTLDNSFGRALPGPSGVVDVAWGAGFQIGAVWDLNDQLTFAVDYQSRVWMQRFEKYTHAFPSTVDRPPVFQVGVDIKKVLPNTIVALDYKFINEEAVETMELQPASDPGGFGWKNIHVIALGLQHQFNSALTLRAGWS